MTAALVRPFSEIGLADIAEVGGKNASLGEMIGALGGKGVSVPQGFATTTEAYRQFIEENGLAPMIAETLAALGAPTGSRLETAARAIRDAILAAPMPGSVAEVIGERNHPSLNAKKTATHQIASASTVVSAGKSNLFIGKFRCFAQRYQRAA